MTRAAKADGGRRRVAMRREVDFKSLEEKWRARWQEQRIYEPDLKTASHPYYNLLMFPYTSAEGLHIGNMYAYIGSDVHGRFQAMRGFDVFEPIGFDAFGIHSENYAIKVGAHPRQLTEANTARFRRQLERIGNRFDWSAEVHTTDPAYYRWTQWIFVKLFKAGLAERKSAAVNWCPKDKTVLADEQVIDGRCERCGSLVIRRWLEQWFFKITNYADPLLRHLDWLDWSERVKAAQRNWIGRAEGLEFEVEIVAAGVSTRVRLFTTRPDTIFGATFVALAPDHPLVINATTSDHLSEVEAYVARAHAAASPSRAMGSTEITGVFTGAYAAHPITGNPLPVLVADYVTMDYGSGAIIGVPAHDARDFALANLMGLPVRRVVAPAEWGNIPSVDTESEHRGELPDVAPGVLMDSGEWTGQPSEEAGRLISEWFQANGTGWPAVHYHLRDWLISRQRYWGPPIPIIYCPLHGAVPVPEEQLPVLLPADLKAFQPDGSGVSPLAADTEFVWTTCPICGERARRETDVSDNFLDSAWYFLRYPSSTEQTRAWDPDLTRKWLPVDMYIGGGEHSVLHLLYSRFITMALHDLGYLPFSEPFSRFRANGTITHDGAKMSKSKGNVVSPDRYIEKVGIDAFRTYLLFMGPYESGGDFSDQGMGGVTRFLDRAWKLVNESLLRATRAEPDAAARRRMHQTIAQLTGDIEGLKYNTAIAALMKYLNTLQQKPGQITYSELRTFVQLLAPFAPYTAEELWERLGERSSVHVSGWPVVDDLALHPSTMRIMVEVNGHVRGHVDVPSDLPAAEVEKLAVVEESVKRALDNQVISRTIYVPGRLVNVVTASSAAP